MEPNALNFSFEHNHSKFYVTCTENINSKNRLDICVSNNGSVKLYAVFYPDFKVIRISKPNDLLESSDPDDRYIWIYDVKGLYAHIRKIMAKAFKDVLSKLEECKKIKKGNVMPKNINKSSDKSITTKNIKTNNENLYLIGDGEFYDLGKEMMTVREEDLCRDIMNKLQRYNLCRNVKGFKDVLSILKEMPEDDKRAMGLNIDIMKVGMPTNTDEGTCPHCGSDDIDWGSLDVEDSYVYYDAYCNKCGESFKIWYNPVYIETTKE